MRIFTKGVTEAVEKVGAIDDAIFAYSDLKEDFVYRRIPRERRSYYIECGIKAGREAAAKYRGADLSGILRSDGVTVRYFPGDVASGLHSQIYYDNKTKQIDIFLKTAERISSAMQGTPYPVTAEEASALFLAHEFYHFLEYSQGRYTDELCEPVRSKFLGIWNQTLKVRRTSEIAAFIFAKDFCRSAIHPKILDFALVASEKSQGFGWVLERIDRLRAEYCAECPAARGPQNKEE